jgi:capsular exopolysaccharide synthesis family protein
MELRHYFDILRRRAIAIAIVTALTVTMEVAVGLLITPIYTARAMVRVIQDVGVLDLGISQSYGERLMNTYSSVLTSWPVLEQAAERLESPLSASQLREKVEIEVVPDTELMKITVHDHDPAFARDFANILSTLLLEHARNPYAGGDKSTLQIVEEQLIGLEDGLEADRQKLAALVVSGAPDAEIEVLKSQIAFKEDSYDRLLDRYELARLNESLRANSVIVAEPATLPRSPSNALGLTEVGISLGVGLFGGLGLALVLENIDTRIHSPQQAERLTHLPVLGTVPVGLLSLDRLEQRNRNGSSRPIEEAYRLLGINLQALKDDVPLKTILVTSAVSREGKSTIVANLAQALAERGQTVFLVEGDLRRPTIAGKLGMELDVEDGGTGLGTLLTERPALNRESLSQVIYPAKQPSLFVIGGGSKVANPTALLASPSMTGLLDYLGTQGQATLLDAPPVVGTADVSVLAPNVDGVILVVRQAQSKREQVLAALKQLQASRARVLGLIFLQKSDKDWSYQ